MQIKKWNLTKGNKNMLCDDCKKNEATFHYKENINNVFTEIHLCESCAKKKNFYDPTSDLFGITQKFEQLFNSDKPAKDQAEPTKKQKPDNKIKQSYQQLFKNDFLKCEFCGLTYAEFRRRGKIGCSECYKYFKDDLTPLLKQIHNASRHTGKRPVIKENDEVFYNEIKKFQEELETAVNSEQYEKAIILRDLIKNAYKKLDKKNNSNKI
ncbi:MAG TPA: UvrB/UvrC motif-containing protein [bacterium]|nr:UvrB/UvrC motif-containing protein [bacterium]HPN30268.1 UvrB/UvrC motif-containing protein [bacterium]